MTHSRVMHRRRVTCRALPAIAVFALFMSTAALGSSDGLQRLRVATSPPSAVGGGGEAENGGAASTTIGARSVRSEAHDAPAAVVFASLAVRVYRTVLSSQDRPSCQFAPSCSGYCVSALRNRGAIEGLLLCADRLERCHAYAAPYYSHDPASGLCVDEAPGPRTSGE